MSTNKDFSENKLYSSANISPISDNMYKNGVKADGDYPKLANNSARVHYLFNYNVRIMFPVLLSLLSIHSAFDKSAVYVSNLNYFFTLIIMPKSYITAEK